MVLIIEKRAWKKRELFPRQYILSKTTTFSYTLNEGTSIPYYKNFHWYQSGICSHLNIRIFRYQSVCSLTFILKSDQMKKFQGPLVCYHLTCLFYQINTFLRLAPQFLPILEAKKKKVDVSKKTALSSQDLFLWGTTKDYRIVSTLMHQVSPAITSITSQTFLNATMF